MGAAKQLWQCLPFSRCLNGGFSARVAWVYCEQLLGYGGWKMRWSAGEQFTCSWHSDPSSYTSSQPCSSMSIFFPVLVSELATFPFPSLDFQQHLRPCKNLNASQFALQFKQALLTKISSQLSSSIFISPYK